MFGPELLVFPFVSCAPQATGVHPAVGVQDQDQGPLPATALAVLPIAHSFAGIGDRGDVYDPQLKIPHVQSKLPVEVTLHTSCATVCVDVGIAPVQKLGSTIAPVELTQFTSRV